MRESTETSLNCWLLDPTACSLIDTAGTYWWPARRRAFASGAWCLHHRMLQTLVALLVLMFKPPQLASTSTPSSAATAERAVPHWAANWQLRPVDGGIFEDLAASQRLTATAQPRAMRSAEAARLVETGNFTPDSLVDLASGGSHGDVVWPRTRRSNGRIFANANPGTGRWPDRRDAGSLLQAERIVDARPADFLSAPLHSREFRYYTCPLEHLAPQLFNDGVVDQRSFGLSEGPGKDAVLEYKGGPLFRLATSGSVCQCHWDSKHNVFVQLHGRKRFYLWPTHALPSLRLHSSKHALYPKSMINFDLNKDDGGTLIKQRFHSDEGGAELASLATSVAVDLEPGDVLYLPPMVPHHVECIGELDIRKSEAGTVAEGEIGTRDWCVGFNVFSTGQFSTTLGAIQQQIHKDALGWFEPSRNAKPKRARAPDGYWPQHPEFVLPMLQYVRPFCSYLLIYKMNHGYTLTEVSDSIGLSMREVARELLANQWTPLRHEGASLGTTSSASARFLGGQLPLCLPRLSTDEDADDLDLVRPLHPALVQEFGRESILVRALATREPLQRLGTNLAVIGSLFPVRQDGDAAMAAVLGEVIEGFVVAAVGLESAFEYMTACLI